jgi:hypothetical protein
MATRPEVFETADEAFDAIAGFAEVFCRNDIGRCDT